MLSSLNSRGISRIAFFVSVSLDAIHDNLACCYPIFIGYLGVPYQHMLERPTQMAKDPRGAFLFIPFWLSEG